MTAKVIMPAPDFYLVAPLASDSPAASCHLTNGVAVRYRSPAVTKRQSGLATCVGAAKSRYAVCKRLFSSLRSTLFGRAGWESREALPVLHRFANPFGSAHPFGDGRRFVYELERTMPASISPTISERQFQTIARAIRIIEASFRSPKSSALLSPQDAKTLLRCRLGHLRREEFHALWLDAGMRLIASETLFVGTLTETAVYPREIVKSALHHNAKSVIFAHNHPSGSAHPSNPDISLRTTLDSALALIDVQVVDHIIVTANECSSFAAGEIEAKRTTPPSLIQEREHG